MSSSMTEQTARNTESKPDSQRIKEIDEILSAIVKPTFVKVKTGEPPTTIHIDPIVKPEIIKGRFTPKDGGDARDTTNVRFSVVYSDPSSGDNVDALLEVPPTAAIPILANYKKGILNFEVSKRKQGAQTFWLVDPIQ